MPFPVVFCNFYDEQLLLSQLTRMSLTMSRTQVHSDFHFSPFYLFGR